MNTASDHNVYDFHQHASKFNASNIIWFTLLLTAVLVVPALAIIVTMFANVTGIAEHIVFIGACWICVFIGLKLVRTQNISPIMFERIVLTDELKNRSIEKISTIQAEVTEWKNNYNKCEAVFMNLSKEPAWGYLNEIVGILGSIKQSAQANTTINFEEIVALHNWVESAKPGILKHYLNTLDASYEYARAEYKQQGKNIEEEFKELGKGSIAVFGKVPSYATVLWHELLVEIKREHPLLAESAMLNTPIAKAA